MAEKLPVPARRQGEMVTTDTEAKPQPPVVYPAHAHPPQAVPPGYAVGEGARVQYVPIPVPVPVPSPAPAPPPVTERIIERKKEVVVYIRERQHHSVRERPTAPEGKRPSTFWAVVVLVCVTLLAWAAVKEMQRVERLNNPLHLPPTPDLIDHGPPNPWKY